MGYGYDEAKQLKRIGWQMTAEQDESENWEVDISQIWYHKQSGKYMLRTASGCSCWDGTFDMQEYDNVDALRHALLEEAQPTRYTPSLKGAEALLRDTEQYLKEHST